MKTTSRDVPHPLDFALNKVEEHLVAARSALLAGNLGEALHRGVADASHALGRAHEALARIEADDERARVSTENAWEKLLEVEERCRAFEGEIRERIGMDRDWEMKSAKEIARVICPHTLHQCESWVDGGDRCATLRAILEYSAPIVEALERAVHALDFAQSVAEGDSNHEHVKHEFFVAKRSRDLFVRDRAES